MGYFQIDCAPKLPSSRAGIGNRFGLEKIADEFKAVRLGRCLSLSISHQAGGSDTKLHGVNLE
jgi:hypothetical protein